MSHEFILDKKDRIYTVLLCPGLAAVDIPRKAAWKPSELQGVLRFLVPICHFGQCHSHYFVSRHGKTKGLWRLSKTKRRNWNVSQSFRIIFQLEMFTEATYRNEQSTARSGRSGSHGPSTTRQASVPVSPEKWRAHSETRLQTQNFSFTTLQYICSIAAQDNLYER